MLLRGIHRIGVACIAALAAVTNASPIAKSLAERAAAADRLVFCHFMIGIVGERTSSNDFDADMQRAKAAGIDAFALNIGVDPYTDTQLGFAYDSAARNGMKVFISFDFNWWHIDQAAQVGQKIAQYASKPAQLFVDNRPFASSFAGDGLDVNAMRSAAGQNVYFVPNFHPGQGDVSAIDGALNWMAWPNNGNNKAPTPGANITVEAGDNAYQSWLGGKPYLAPVSPWFSTHYGPEVSYSKNWVFPSGPLIFQRWNEVLQNGFPMVEMVTWNDYGESHYVGPLNSLHFDDGNSKWTNDMPHDGWLDLSTPFIAAYKAGATSPKAYIQDDKIVYWYRRNLNSINCDATDTTEVPANNASGNYFEGKPNGWQDFDDVVYIATLLTADATLTVNSGGNTQTFQATAGAQLFTIPAGLGKQQFEVSRGGQAILSGTSLMDITDVCPCGIYNYNAYVGTLPPGFSDPLQHDGLASLTMGLHVTTCFPTPSLGTNPPVTTTSSKGTTTTTTTSTTQSTSGSSQSTTTTKSTTTSSTSVNQPTSTTSAGTPPPQTCNGGTNADGETGNYIGLCNFACSQGYCPPGPCKCTSYGSPSPPPPSNGRNGCPLPGEGAGYLGLCSYCCSHGYCPDTACRYC